jgi:peptide/nickel transport system substrate-binding protein
MGKPGTLIMGTGPWKFDSLDPTKGAELSAWSGYWGPKKPQFKHLSFKFFSDVTSMALAFRAGAIYFVPEINDARAWKATTGVNPTVVPGCEVHMFGMPTTAPPWNDVHVRRAVAHAMNRRELIQSRGSPAYPVTTLILPVQLYRLAPKAVVDKMIASLPQYPFDLAKAKAELAKSAYPNGFSANFPTPLTFFGNEPQVIAAQLAKIGIKLTVQNVPFPDWIDHIFGKHDIPALTYATCLTGDAHDYVTNYLESGAISNYRPPALKALDRQSVFYSNAAKRFAVYTKLLRLLATDVPFVPEYSGYAVMAISPKFAWPTFDGSGWLTRDYIQEIRPK